MRAPRNLFPGAPGDDSFLLCLIKRKRAIPQTLNSFPFLLATAARSRQARNQFGDLHRTVLPNRERELSWGSDKQKIIIHRNRKLRTRPTSDLTVQMN